ncbi:hypothetical protein R1flu_024598 [Riccia fluitans]|uniref:Uncharacterized protein n=1 Tax=Riccia fluitans TaxID=41844 RepID=A0ABD1XVC8_9MARC
MGATQQLTNQVTMYEQSTQILADVGHLGNHIGLTYTSLILEKSTRFLHVGEQMHTFKEKLAKVPLMAKETLAIDDTVVADKKAAEKWNDELHQQIADLALQHISQDQIAQQWIASLQAAHEAYEATLKE